MLTFSRFTRYFAAIAELGSIRKAAEALHVSASAIDRQVLQAEKTIGAPLFERFHGGLRPTAAGEIFIGLIRRWQQEYQHALAQVDELQGLKRGHVEIAVIDALTEGMVAEAIGRISAAHPGLTVGVQVLDNEEVARQISSCAVDFGLLLQPASMTGLEALHSIDIPLGVVFQRGHILGEHARLRLSQTLDFKTILPGAPLVISDHVNALYERHQVDTSTFMSCNNTQMMRSLVREGVGIGVLCWLDVVADVSHQRLEFRALEDPRLLPLKLHLCVASRRQISYTARESIPYFQKSMVGTEYDDAIQPARWRRCGHRSRVRTERDTRGNQMDVSRKEAVGEKYQLASMHHARGKTWEVVERIAKVVRPGMTESEATAECRVILAEMGMDRIWHPVLIRFGENTLRTFSQRSEGDPQLKESDIFFVDLGVVWNQHEGDAGATFVVGDDAEMKACAEAAKTLFDEVEHYWKSTGAGGKALYDYAAERASALGWRLNLDIKGHRVSDFPHAIYKAGDLGDFEEHPHAGLWILEIQIAHLTRPFGAFYEDLLA